MKVQYVCTEEERSGSAVVSGIKQTKLDFESRPPAQHRATRSIRLWSASPMSLRMPLRAPWPSSLRKPTTRCFSMAAVGMGKTHLMHAIGHHHQEAQSGHAAELRQRGKVHHRSDQLAAF